MSNTSSSWEHCILFASVNLFLFCFLVATAWLLKLVYSLLKGDDPCTANVRLSDDSHI